ncbi:hypothetical protein FW774_18515 [Pedobacter sp. BS3]|uniref:hypothetical protein n=1 Tax=Pedobacter sp. BS3 TaxID=2567937 RepID=UPI0011EBDA8F|nr:hypothetical protein [Pedobacter sp. BS3]TZF81543.1 hypothetical protein FW774_18515 [Pedobacter sp. BS3]
MAHHSAQPGLKLKRPAIWYTLNLVKNKFLVFSILSSDFENIEKLKKSIHDFVSVITDIPIIFPVTNDVLQLLSAQQINAGNLHTVVALDRKEVNFLLIHALGLVVVQSYTEADASAVGLSCYTIPSLNRGM